MPDWSSASKKGILGLLSYLEHQECTTRENVVPFISLIL